PAARGTDHPILSSRASSAASLPPVRRPNHASRFEGIAKTNLQASTASDTETLQSQVNKAAKKRLSLSELEILHGRLELEQGASPSRGPSALTIQNDTARALNSAVYSHRIPWSQIDAKPFETVVFLKILRAWLAPSASKRDRQLGHAVRP